MSDKLILRYTDQERANHWVVAISFLLLALSGLALFHPTLYWLTNLFGGGPWTRILHPFIGVAMAASFFGLATKFWRFNRITDNDRQWLRQFSDVVNAREERLPPVGRYNGGQKVMFLGMVGCMAVLAVSGLLIWRPWFAPLFPIGLVRLGVMLHALAAWTLIAGLIVHVYAAIWVKGTFGAMVRGTVTREWARKHHPAWYRDVTGGGQ